MWHVPAEWLGHYLTSNAIALSLVVVAWFRPTIARYLFALMFFLASIANSTAVLRDPDSYVEYSQFAVLDLYRNFILGFFAEHVQAFVLPIALGQLLVALLLAFGGRFWKLGALGAAIFFVAITPLAIGGAFPFQLVAIAALVILVARSRLHSAELAPAIP